MSQSFSEHPRIFRCPRCGVTGRIGSKLSKWKLSSGRIVCGTCYTSLEKLSKLEQKKSKRTGPVVVLDDNRVEPIPVL